MSRARWAVSVVSTHVLAGRVVPTWNETPGPSRDKVVHQIKPQHYRHAALIGGQCKVSSVADPDELKAPLRLDVLIGLEPERCR